MDRRTLLRTTVIGAGAAVALPFTTWSAAYAAPAQNVPSPYGPLQPADANGIQLPAGFSSQVIARSTQVVAGTSYVWHNAPDGGAVIPSGAGWVYVSNSEVCPASGGGVSKIDFDASGNVTGAARILSGTDRTAPAARRRGIDCS
jgi:hypothetical protein